MSDMTWKTAIAEVRSDDVVVRGHRLSELVGSITYSDMAFLLIRGDLPQPRERSMLEAILVCLADHGISPSTIVARTLISCGSPVQAGMAGGMLSIADHHGGSGEEVAQILIDLLASADHPSSSDISAASDAFVKAKLAARQQITGFGHPQHTDGDPRALQLLGLARDLGVAGRHCDALSQLGTALGAATGKPALRSANVTGAIAGILLDLGFPWSSIRGLVISARSLGMTAHIVEELEQGNRWRHAPAEDVDYVGLPAAVR